jgi:hypothetical protein
MVTSVVRGPSIITFRGEPLERAHGFVDLPELVCPDLHRMKLGGFTILDSGALACMNKARAGRSVCGALMYLLQIPANRHRRRFYAADVEYRELELWEARGYVAEDVLRYLGAWFSRRSDVPHDQELARALERRVG